MFSFGFAAVGGQPSGERAAARATALHERGAGQVQGSTGERVPSGECALAAHWPTSVKRRRSIRPHLGRVGYCPARTETRRYERIRRDSVHAAERAGRRVRSGADLHAPPANRIVSVFCSIAAE